MKNIFVAALLLLSLVDTAFAGGAPEVVTRPATVGERLVVINGEVNIPRTIYYATGVKVTPEAQKYPDAIGLAFNTPGKEVVVRDTIDDVQRAVAGLFEYKKVTTNSKLLVVYDQKTSIVDVVKSTDTTLPESNFFWFPAWWLVSILATLTFVRAKKEFVFRSASHVAHAAVICAGISSVTLWCWMFIIPSAIFIAALLEGKNGTSKRSANELSAIKSAYFAVMVMGLGLTYSPLFF